MFCIARFPPGQETVQYHVLYLVVSSNIPESEPSDFIVMLSTLRVPVETTVRSTTCLLEWPKFKILTAADANKDAEQQELMFIAGGNVKWYSHFGKTVWQFLPN